MPHCETCLQFYPAAMPAGCPLCDKQGYHKKCYCQFCHTQVAAKEVDAATGQPLRPNCPNCGKGPLIPTSAELKRRLTLDPAVEPFVPTVDEIKAMTADGGDTTVKIDGELLAELSIRRTHGPIELFVKSPMIENYFAKLNAAFGASAEPRPYVAPSPSNPYNGMKYYPVSVSNLVYYNREGNVTYYMKGFGYPTTLPGKWSRERGETPSADMSFLLTAGLRDGVTFKYMTVIDNNSIRDCLLTLKDGLIAFYFNLMRPISHSVIIGVRTQMQQDVPAKPVRG